MLLLPDEIDVVLQLDGSAERERKPATIAAEMVGTPVLSVKDKLVRRNEKDRAAAFPLLP